MKKLLQILIFTCVSISIFAAEQEATLPESLEQDILAGKVEEVAAYFDKHVDHINLKTKMKIDPYNRQYNLTTLMLAVKSDSLPMFREILSRTKDVNQANNNGFTPLLYLPQAKISKDNALKFADLLLQNNAFLDVQEANGNTPVIAAIYDTCFNLAEFLIERNADLKLKSNDGWTVLHFITQEIHIAKSQKVKEHAKAIAKTLIRRNADLNAVNNYCYTPLITAISYLDIELVEFLLDNGAKIDFIAKHPLDENHNSIALTQTIHLRRNANQSQKDELFKIIELLIARKASLKSLKINDNTYLYSPLVIAAAYHDFEIVKLLVEAEADINEKIVIANNKTALDYAKEYYAKEVDEKNKREYRKIIRYLENHYVYMLNESRAMFVFTLLNRGSAVEELKDISDYIGNMQVKTQEVTDIAKYIEKQIEIKSKTMVPDLTDIIVDYIHEPVKKDDADINEFKKLLVTNDLQSINAMIELPALVTLKDEAGDTPLILMIKYYAYNKIHNKLTPEIQEQALTIIEAILQILNLLKNNANNVDEKLKYLAEMDNALCICKKFGEREIIELPEVVKFLNQYLGKSSSSSSSSSSSASSAVLSLDSK